MNTTCEAYLLLCVCLLAGGCKEQPVSTQTGTAAPQMEVQQEPLQPLPVVAPQDRKVVALGAALFSETRLSSDGTVACASCHDLAKGGQDGRRVSLGVGGLLGEVNAPSVLNSGLNFVQFWDGRAASLEDQAGAPLTNPREMKSTWANVLSFLRTDPEYDQRFRLAFGTQADEASVRSALASFERSLITRNSRFDRWLGGEKTLTPNEVAGYERFKGVGCIACHQGANVGGNMFQRFGVMGEILRRPRTHPSGGLRSLQRHSPGVRSFRVPRAELAERRAHRALLSRRLRGYAGERRWHDGQVSTG